MANLPKLENFNSMQEWADALSQELDRKFNDPAGSFLVPQPIALSFIFNTSGQNLGVERAGTPGVLMYNPSIQQPVYSDGVQWHPIAKSSDTKLILETGFDPPTPDTGFAVLYVDNNNNLRIKFDDGTTATVTTTNP